MKGATVELRPCYVRFDTVSRLQRFARANLRSLETNCLEQQNSTGVEFGRSSQQVMTVFSTTLYNGGMAHYTSKLF